MKRQKMQGFVLFSVLIFLQVFSLLSLYSLTSAVAAIKQNDEKLQQLRLEFQGDVILQQIETHAESAFQMCGIVLTPALELARKPLIWWQMHGCHGRIMQQNYYYTVERREDDACAYIKMSDNTSTGQILNAQYYRITVLVLPAQLKGARYYLQSTVAVKGNHAVSCQGALHPLSLGRQMWREV